MKFSKKPVIRAYLLMFVLMLLVVVICLFISRGQLISKYLFRDELDTGMDFFNSITYVSSKRPYQDYKTLYSPFANLVYLLLYRFVCGKIVFPKTFDEGIANRGTTHDLRLFQSTTVTVLFFSIFVFIIIFILILEFLDKEEKKIKYLVTASVLLSYGTVFALERGNILLLSFFNTLFFLLYYRNKNKLLSELALVSLAFSFGLKLYPAIFGLLLILDKRYFAAVRCCTYALAVIVLPCFAFEEGLQSISLWIEQVITFSSRSADFSGNSLSQLTYLLNDLLAIKINQINISCFCIVLIVLMFFAIFITKDRIKRIVLLTTLMVVATSQANYIFCFYTIPVIYMIRYRKTFSFTDVLVLFFLFILTANLPIFDSDLYASIHLIITIVLIFVLIVDIYYRFVSSFLIRKE